jgi:hypothetical protein
MTQRDPDQLAGLLPEFIRARDAAAGSPLRALLAVITEQADIVASDLDQLYADWFVETCQDWVLAYLGDLVGHRVPPGAAGLGAARTPSALARVAALNPRRDVANAVRNRRRKGTLAVLEELAADVAGWPARAVEHAPLLALTQPVRLYGTDPEVNRMRRRRGRLIDVRDGALLDLREGPFDRLAHTAEMPRPASALRGGRYDIPDVMLFAWRLRPYPVTMTPAHRAERSRNHYTFSVLGNDTDLVVAPQADPGHPAGEADVPGFIRRRAFADRTGDFFGPGRSLMVWRDGPDHPVQLNDVVAADLTDWAYRPRDRQVAIDPVLGRLSFAAGRAPKNKVWVSYHYAFSDDTGGGQYPRHPEPAPEAYLVGHHQRFRTIMAAVNHWRRHKDPKASRRTAVVEITDNAVYQEQITLDVAPGDELTLRAAEGARPVIQLPDPLLVQGAERDGPAPQVTLDGLLIAGDAVRVVGPVGALLIRHCTLVPGWGIDCDCEPMAGEEPSLELDDPPDCTHITRSILGSVTVGCPPPAGAPPLLVEDTIMDATAGDLPALSATDGGPAPVMLSLARCTVLGCVDVRAVNLVENSIVTGVMTVSRRQHGCVRFSSVPPGSSTPRRYHCQPDLVIEALPNPTPEPMKTLASARVRPRFTSTRYGTPGYGQLAQACAEEISSGADDESEMGAFHDLYQPQRATALRTRVDEYVPADAEAAVFFVT